MITIDALLAQILDEALALRSSDIRVASESAPWVKVNGCWQAMNSFGVLMREQVNQIMLGILHESGMADLDQGNDHDVLCAHGGARFRVNAYNDINGPAMVLRALAPGMPSIDELGLPPKLKDLVRADKGLFMVTGSTGSGKSTSLAAIINYLNQNFTKHIITIEDPVEYIHTPIKSIITQRAIGQHTQSFGSALKSALREAPDIILIGELRDRETAEQAVHAAETGHMVFTTVHTGSAAHAVDRVVGMFPPDDKHHIRHAIASNLVGVLTQQLVQRKDGKGRAAAAELLVATVAVRNIIATEGKPSQLQNAMQLGKEFGMVTMEESLKNLGASQNAA